MSLNILVFKRIVSSLNLKEGVGVNFGYVFHCIIPQLRQ